MECAQCQPEVCKCHAGVPYEPIQQPFDHQPFSQSKRGVFVNRCGANFVPNHWWKGLEQDGILGELGERRTTQIPDTGPFVMEVSMSDLSTRHRNGNSPRGIYDISRLKSPLGV